MTKLRASAISLLLLHIGCGGDSQPSGNGAGGACTSSACAHGACGDGVVGDGEDCDPGAGGGCDASCHFACHADGDCDDKDACNGKETCGAAGAGRSCAASSPVADGTSCSASPPSVCIAGACKPSACGDGIVDAASGEQCDPPGSAGCGDGCVLVGCGDGRIKDTEQCDDGSANNLDGCDATCRYETVLRFTSVTVEIGAAPSWCSSTTNQFGSAVTQAAADVINYDLGTALDDGTLDTMLDLMGLDDPSGKDDPNLLLGIVAGALDPKNPTPWAKGAVDAWFLADPSTIDRSGLPLSILAPASITSGAIDAGPTDVTVPLLLGTTPATLLMRNARLRASVDDPPMADVPAPPPTALAAGLAVFRSVSASTSDRGLCGDLTVDSLAKIPLPEAFATGGVAACTEACPASLSYTYCGVGNPVGPGCNSLLDAIVGGCTVNPPDCVAVFVSRQPDIGSNGDPPAMLAVGAGNKVATPVPSDAYSGYFRFSANRAHVTNNVP